MNSHTSKQRRPGEGPVPRGAEIARREAAHERRVRVQREGTPAERSAINLPYQGSIDFLERFWANVEERGSDECWPWVGPIDTRANQGYGNFRLAKTATRAHRLALILSTATDLPTEVFACHRCDNPPCCNPAHLFPGSALDNNRDAIAKGRRPAITHCKRGHPLTPDNLCPVKSRYPIRKCRACARRLGLKNYYLRIGKPDKAAEWA